MSSEVNYILLQSKHTLRERKQYLKHLFKDKDGPEWVNKWFFNIEPVKPDDNYKVFKRTGNFFRRCLRKTLRPFVTTYLEENSGKLTAKKSISVQHLILSNFKLESFSSWARLGASQLYKETSAASLGVLLLATPVFLTAASVVSFGVVPLVICSLLGAGLMFLSYRSYKKKHKLGHLEFKKRNLRKSKDLSERLFVKMNTLVTLLEDLKKTIQNMLQEEAKGLLLDTIDKQLKVRGYVSHEYLEILLLKEFIKKDKEDFVKSLSEKRSIHSMSSELDSLIDKLEKIDIVNKVDSLRLDPEDDEFIDKALDPLAEIPGITYDRIKFFQEQYEIDCSRNNSNNKFQNSCSSKLGSVIGEESSGSNDVGDMNTHVNEVMSTPSHVVSSVGMLFEEEHLDDANIASNPMNQKESNVAFQTLEALANTGISRIESGSQNGDGEMRATLEAQSQNTTHGIDKNSMPGSGVNSEGPDNKGNGEEVSSPKLTEINSSSNIVQEPELERLASSSQHGMLATKSSRNSERQILSAEEKLAIQKILKAKISQMRQQGGDGSELKRIKDKLKSKEPTMSSILKLIDATKELSKEDKKVLKEGIRKIKPSHILNGRNGIKVSSARTYRRAV